MTRRPPAAPPLTRQVLPLLAALLARSVFAAGPELLLPAEPVSPDGFEVRVVGGGALSADGAVLQAAPEKGTWRVFPRPRVQLVTLEVGARRQALRVGPPATSVALTLSPATPVKGRDRDATLEVVVKGADGQPDPESAPPVLRANVGAVEALERTGPGRYRARYVLPTTRYPEVAVVVAFAAWPHPQSIHGAVGTLRVPLASAVELPGRTEAGAEMRLEIAGQQFGPVTAGPDGAFKLPVVVPPGYGKAKGTARDRIGNKRTVPIDLMLPPVDQLACVATPTRLPADGASKALVLCASSDVFGGVAAGARVRLQARRGAVGEARELGGGITEWTWTAPRERGDGVEAITATWKQGRVDAREDLRIELVQGPVAAARLAEAAEPLAHRGGRWPFTVAVEDSLGRPVPGVSAEAFVVVGDADGGVAPKPSGPRFNVEASDAKGRTAAAWQVEPEGVLGGATLVVRAWGPMGSEPARVSAWREGDVVRAAVTDLAGLPIADQPLRLEQRSLKTGADGTVSLGALADGVWNLRHELWPGLHLRLYVSGGALFPSIPPPGRAEVQVPLTVAPAVPVNVRVEREAAGLLWWIEGPDGKVLDGREVEVTVNGRASRVQARGKARVPFEAGAEALALSVVDVASRVAVVAEVRK